MSLYQRLLASQSSESFGIVFDIIEHFHIETLLILSFAKKRPNQWTDKYFRFDILVKNQEFPVTTAVLLLLFRFDPQSVSPDNVDTVENEHP